MTICDTEGLDRQVLVAIHDAERRATMRPRFTSLSPKAILFLTDLWTEAKPVKVTRSVSEGGRFTKR